MKVKEFLSKHKKKIIIIGGIVLIGTAIIILKKKGASTKIIDTLGVLDKKGTFKEGITNNELLTFLKENNGKGGQTFLPNGIAMENLDAVIEKLKTMDAGVFMDDTTAIEILENIGKS